MSTPPLLLLPPQDRIDIINQTAERIGMPPFAVEKDWWVVRTLEIVFGTSAAKALVFKGGTSLSKGWNLIQRLSEDIDLVIDREFLGFKGEISKSQVSKLRIKAGEYTADKFYQELQKNFANNNFSGVKFELVKGDDDVDPRVIFIEYPNLIAPPGYIDPKVKIEIGCRSLIEPYTDRTFSSFIDELYVGQPFAQSPITVPVVNPDRTLLEKVFLMHEELQKPKEKIKVLRMSRHLSDIAIVSKTEVLEKALANQELYSTIVEHRHKFNRVTGIDYNLHQPQSINPIPSTDFLEEWRKDYEAMAEQMFYDQEPLTFDEVMEQMRSVTKQINDLPWTIEMPYLEQRRSPA